jgi:hypothetical protein
MAAHSAPSGCTRRVVATLAVMPNLPVRGNAAPMSPALNCCGWISWRGRYPV